MAREYVFVDEWDVRAPREAVFATLADASTYPAWWRPVYRHVVTRGEPGVGQTSDHYFKGKLPYTLRLHARTSEFEPPHRFAVQVDGDLTGTGVWTFTERDGGTHVRWDWTVLADKLLLRTLTPVLRPLFRWNRAWAVARAREGLEPYVRSLAG